MRDKTLILANLFQKMALWQIEINRENRLKEHIRMLDWVIGRSKDLREIEDIMSDDAYKLSPRDYLLKYEA